jgi:hypothetical protein
MVALLTPAALKPTVGMETEQQNVHSLETPGEVLQLSATTAFMDMSAESRPSTPIHHKESNETMFATATRSAERQG